MKANFSLSKRFTPKFLGNDKLPGAEQLIAVLNMPEVADVFAIIDRLSAAGFQKGEAGSLSMKQATQITVEAGSYLPKYVTLENAEDFKIEDVVKYPPYFPLATELLFALVEFAQPTEADTKNS